MVLILDSTFPRLLKKNNIKKLLLKKNIIKIYKKHNIQYHNFIIYKKKMYINHNEKIIIIL